MFYAHAQKSEHAQYVLLFYVHAYWLEWTEHAHWRMFCVHTHCHYYFEVRDVNRTLSHIWWRLYLPTFLLSVWLLTLMCIDSLMALARPWSSLPIMIKVIRVGAVSWLATVSISGWGFLQVLFISFSKGPGCLSYIFLITCELPTLIPVGGPTLSV